MSLNEPCREVLSLWHGRMTIGRRTLTGRFGRTLDEIATATAEKHGVSVVEMKSQARCRDISIARQEAMWLAYQERRPDGSRVYSRTRIGHYFGGRDHTTVLNGCRRHEERAAAIGVAS